jgi:site-specific DNA-methyltransferase (adenine-specific)
MYDAADNSSKSYDVAISSLRERLEKSKVVIGDCTLYCEDCRFILPTLHNIDAVVTDPPYGISYVSSRRKHGDTIMLNEDDRAAIDTVAMMARPLRDGGAMYLCTRFDVAPLWQQTIEQAGLTLKTPIVWDKTNHTSGDLTGDYGNQVELILFAHKGRHVLRNGRDANLWRIARPLFGDHPTPKPVALMARMIRNSTDAGDTVLDAFMGGGPTAIACMQLGRKFIGIEKDAGHFKAAARRIEQAYAQGDLFVAAPSAKPKQLDLEESLSNVR